MTTNYSDFATWLKSELKARGLRQADLSREGGIDPAYITRVIKMERPASSDFCVRVARVLKVDEGIVFARAGLMSPKPPLEEEADQFRANFEQMTVEERRYVNNFMTFLLSQRNLRRMVKDDEEKDSD